MFLNQEFPTKLLPDGSAMLIVVEKPFFPRAVSTDDGSFVFADVSGELSRPIPIPPSVSIIEVQMLWNSADFIFHVDVPTQGWVNIHGTPCSPSPEKGMKRVFSYSTPHTPSYAGGDGSDMVIRLSTVLRPGDLPFRRDERGTWTASGLLLEYSSDIPFGRPFQVYDLETQQIIPMA